MQAVTGVLEEHILIILSYEVSFLFVSSLQ